jgi:hypothetical protein
MRFGVVSDPHLEFDPPRQRRWINPFEPHRVEQRLAEAIERFGEANVDAVVLLGDVTETGDRECLERIFELFRLPVPVAVVMGNHDLDGDPDVFEQAARNAGICFAPSGTLLWHDVELCGVAVETVGEPISGYRSAHPLPDKRDSFRVVASHFPLISEAELLATAGLPYARDLDDRQTLGDRLAAAGQPIVVFSGHIHARCSRSRGPILQLGFASLIEPPFDCAVVEITPDQPPTVERHSWRLGPIAQIDPVFADADEGWTWTHGSWRRTQET